jgi:hypothetical protein
MKATMFSWQGGERLLLAAEAPQQASVSRPRLSSLTATRRRRPHPRSPSFRPAHAARRDPPDEHGLAHDAPDEPGQVRVYRGGEQAASEASC